MGFSGVRALILVGILIGLIVMVTKFNFPGWFVAVGIVLAGALLKGWEKKSSL
jgi:hypothetical protein